MIPFTWCNKAMIPDFLTDEGTSTGEFTICSMEMQLTSISKMRAAYWEYLQVETSIVRMECNI
jgi:hypothetical protein